MQGDVVKLPGETPPGTLPANPLQPVPQCLRDRLRLRLSRIPAKVSASSPVVRFRTFRAIDATPYQRIRPRSIRPCSGRLLRLSRRSPSRPSSNAGLEVKRTPRRLPRVPPSDSANPP